ncbi:ATP-dependent DNA helicase PIF1-like protein [Tanacetum coccineum]
MGYQKTPGAGTSGGGSKGYTKGGGYVGYGSSKGFGGFGGSRSSGGSGGEDSNKKITPISEVDPMLDVKRHISFLLFLIARQDVVHATINSSYLWEHCTVLKLTVNMRLGSGATDCERKEIQDFADWILDIGNGNIGGKNDGESTVEFPDNMLIPESDDHEDEGVKINTCLGFYFVVDADDTNFNLDLYTTDFLNTINVVRSPDHLLR